MHPQIPVPAIEGVGWRSYSISVLAELSLSCGRWRVGTLARDSAVISFIIKTEPSPLPQPHNLPRDSTCHSE